jgi:hypothetical protein
VANFVLEQDVGGTGVVVECSWQCVCGLDIDDDRHMKISRSPTCTDMCIPIQPFQWYFLTLGKSETSNLLQRE